MPDEYDSRCADDTFYRYENLRLQHWRRLTAKTIIKPFVDHLVAEGVLPSSEKVQVEWTDPPRPFPVEE